MTLIAGLFEMKNLSTLFLSSDTLLFDDEEPVRSASEPQRTSGCFLKSGRGKDKRRGTRQPSRTSKCILGLFTSVHFENHGGWIVFMLLIAINLIHISWLGQKQNLDISPD